MALRVVKHLRHRLFRCATLLLFVISCYFFFVRWYRRPSTRPRLLVKLPVHWVIGIFIRLWVGCFVQCIQADWFVCYVNEMKFEGCTDNWIGYTFNQAKRDPMEPHWSEWSGWGPCSRTCDGGATYQTRQCVDTVRGCSGKSIRYQICNMQVTIPSCHLFALKFDSITF